MKKSSKSIVSKWLFLGCVMVFVQILIGGITRLTDSGLSITEWDIVKGTLPPLNEAEWLATFEKYKIHAQKQFNALHADMSLSHFKRIFFWEYFHRLWARIMGFVFIIPFVYFLITKKLNDKLIRQLIVVVLLAALAATFGWIMVASGLNDDSRTWVSAYKLLIHLMIAGSLFGYLTFTYYHHQFKHIQNRCYFYSSKLLPWIGVLLFVQIAFGALMAGMKAALVFPYPSILFKTTLFGEMIKTLHIHSIDDLINYEPNSGIKLLVQIIHRATAWILGGLITYFTIKNIHYHTVKLFISLLILQIILGIITVSFSMGKIPAFWGVFHQGVAFLLLANWVFLFYIRKK